jgi:phosphoribosylanthranilate isomerase
MTGAARASWSAEPIRPWVKICGVTRPEDAELAARLGARFVGVNFWNGSKRRIDESAAREIAAAVPEPVELVGVFVNEDPARIEEIAAATGLDRIQLHGDERNDIVAHFGRRALRAMRPDGPLASLVEVLAATAAERAYDGILAWDAALESAGLSLQWKVFAVILDSLHAGARYGGTGETWDWSLVRPLCERSPIPVLIAGGIEPSNAGRALLASRADGVDVASGVESASGIKDRDKMEKLFEEVARVRPES